MLKRCEREVMMVDDLALAKFVRFTFSFLLLFGKPIKGHIDPCTLPNRRDGLSNWDKRTVTNCLQNYRSLEK